MNGTGSVNGKNDEQIEGLELRYETRNQQTTALELRFNPPIFAWAADVYSLDGKSFGEDNRNRPDSNDHTTMQILTHTFDLTQIFPYAGSGYNSFFGIVSDKPFDRISFTSSQDGDRWRMDNISIVRSGGHFWGQQVFPALWLNSGDGAFTGIRVSNVDIVDPTYDGVMFQTKYVGSSATNPIADTVLTNVTVDRANEPRPDGSNVDATAASFNLTGRVGNAVWCNAAPEPGQGPAIGAVTFTNLVMTNNSHDIVNTCPNFTITRN